MEIPKQYDPKQAEQNHYERWEKNGFFAPEINQDPNAPVFSIVIPPPNVTGSLHMGHALQHTLMDVMTRHRRMAGYRTLWLPGMDHAGISTQLMVVRALKKEEGKTRHDLGRELFVERVWKWKRESGGQITVQMRREGASVDWSREKFTMNEDLSRAVREVFVRLYDEGWIYRGNRIVNWCPQDQTVLSDLEVDKLPQAGKLYYLQYPIKNSDRRITVATTRPETMLGDTAVAVNPNDERYADLKGQTVLLPLTDREIPIIADDFVDPQFGTGAVKVTPAHDPNDYEMGQRHDLPQVVVIDQHAKMTADAGAGFAGLDRYAAREKVVAEFESLGLLEKVVDYEFSISKCERCKTVIEPLISTQWFMKMDQLRDLALDLMAREKKPRFVPETYEKVYTNWLENLRDWTISRQLWWGHQIPAWYTPSGEVIVARSEEEAREKAGTSELTQDQDVLDTWFSSALWPFSTLGWPDETQDLETFYPTSVLVTARDIIFLWVSRMVMTGLKFIGKEPFADVYITGTILDAHGQRMAKTKANGVDPLDVFDKFGVDATRLTLAQVGTTDTRWNEKQVESYRNFANKIWNAARFCLLYSEGASVKPELMQTSNAQLALHDRWIISRLNKTARDMNNALNAYEFHAAVQILYHFFWDDFCDWYIELTKADVISDADTPQRTEARSRLLTVLEQALRLLHPFMPYITEELWQRLPGEKPLHAAYKTAEPTVMLTAYPQGGLIDEAAEAEMSMLITLVSGVRNIRSEHNLKPSDRIAVLIGIQNANLRKVFEENTDQIARLTGASSIDISASLTAPKASAKFLLTSTDEVAVPLEGLVDFAEETKRLQKKKEKLQGEETKLQAQLANPDFAVRAPADKVEQAKNRLDEVQLHMKALDQLIENLQ
jgi:valyl-tRNA synthetase